MHDDVPAIHIRLLGRFEVARGARTLEADDWRRRKAAALLQRLALERRLLRDEALDFLWPDADPAAAANNLYRTLYSLRQTLDEALGEGASQATLSFNDGVLRLADEVWVDVQAFEARCEELSASTAQLQETLSLYEGPLLPDGVYDDWTAVPRQTLHRLYRDACLRLADEATERRDIESAITRLRPLLKKDRADEDVQRRLMRLYALLGRRHDALRQYRACMEALDEELGLPPAPETRDLHQKILQSTLTVPSQAVVPRPPAVEKSTVSHSPLVAHDKTPIAGRRQELQRLQAILKGVADGEGKTVLIEGVTGVGKTRLARELLNNAAAMGMTVLWGAAYEFEGHLAYQPFVEAIDHFLAQTDRDRTENPLANFRPENASDPQQAKWALFDSAASFVTGAGGDAPVVLFVDDLHAADEGTLQLFHYLARHMRSQPFLLGAACRTDVRLEAPSPFGALRSALYREGLRETIALAPLETGAITSVVRHILTGDVAPQINDMIAAGTEGNPFFAEEMCRALLDSGRITRRDGVWQMTAEEMPAVPMDLRQLLRQRIAQAGSATVSTLEVAAIVGRTFNLEILRRVAVPEGADLIDALDAALQAEFIEEADRGYRFRHGLIRRALQDAQSRPRRRRLHARIAEAIEDTCTVRGEAPDEQVEALAYHYEHSDRPQRALPHLIRAGQRAADFYAFEAAVDIYERALALMDKQGLNDRARRWRLLESLGWWEKVLANTPRAVGYFEQALALEGAPEWERAPNERARLHAGAAMALLTVGDTSAAEPHLNAAEALIDEENYASEYADILYNVAQLHWHRNQYEAAFEAAQRSLRIAEKLDDAGLVARAFEMLALACHSLGEWQLGLDFEEKRSALVGPELDVSDAFDAHL